DMVGGSVGAGGPRDVVAKLLDGWPYNYIILGADNDINKLEKVVLSPKGSPAMSADGQPISPQSVPVASMQQPPVRSTPPGVVPPPPPPDDPQPQGDSMPPDTTPQPGDPESPPN